MQENEKKLSDLCVSCGMCCDGTLFENAFVRHEDDRKVADTLGLVTHTKNDTLYFHLPCPQFRSCCLAYDRARPLVCAAFFCPPIKRFQAGQQSLDEADEQVTALISHRDKLLELASEFPELAQLNIKDLRTTLEAYAEDQEKVSRYRMLFLFFFIFRDTIDKYFLSDKDKKHMVR